jgi:arsenate reductase
VTGKPLRVLFVCLGNACRSQMAEAFARAYGSDVMVPASAGVSPAMYIPHDTLRAMQEKNLDLRDHFPKSLRHVSRLRFDLVVNMSGTPLPSGTGARIVSWDIPDPVTLNYEEHCKVRDLIERRVMNLILELRAPREPGRLATVHKSVKH